MGEMYQESADFEVTEEEEEEEEEDLQEATNLSLHIGNVKNNNRHHQNRHDRRTTCACCNVAAASKTTKRPSPPPISEPNSKRPSFDNHHHHKNPLSNGFSKLRLPPLQRTASDPSSYTYTPPKPNLSENIPKALEDSPLSKGNVPCSALPPIPKPPVLRRTISEPIVSPVKSSSRSSSSVEMGMESIKEESPIDKRYKRMKERMNEMRQWWDEAMQEVEEEVCTTENEENAGLECEEAVSVEIIGDCLDLHFKCPCGKGYKILLSGKNCYYKLI